MQGPPGMFTGERKREQRAARRHAMVGRGGSHSDPSQVQKRTCLWSALCGRQELYNRMIVFTLGAIIRDKIN